MPWLLILLAVPAVVGARWAHRHFWKWATARRDALESDDRLAAAPPGPIDYDLMRLLREAGD